MSPQNDVNVWTLGDLSTPWCVHVVSTLRVADRMTSGITRIEDLAGAVGADRDALHRVLRHLVEKGLFEEPAPGTFAVNEPARALLDPGVQLVFDLESFGGRMAYAWCGLFETVRAGAPAYDKVFGQPFWQDLQAHPEIAAKFDALMGPAGHGTPDPEVLLSGDWDRVRTVVDVGGGTGALLAEILRAHPDIRGTLVDLPGTIERSHDLLEAAGVADRVTTSAQSFFDPLPAGADLYLLKNLLADWPDAEASALLTRCAEAARPTGRLIVNGGITPEEGEGPIPALLMLVLVGGRERRLAEFQGMALASGWRVSQTGRQKSGRFLVECCLT